MVYVVAEERERVLMRLGDDRHLGYGDPDVMIGPRGGPFAIMRLIDETDMVLNHYDGDTPGGCLAAHTGPIPAHASNHMECEIANGLEIAHEREARLGER